ncbi:acetylxylan esterase [Streptacidiphilus griseoplanus]|uniref:acetylxylan esterase n=1 Tax=Peterkaempfera griseoplana TaxID=66896 RepID=UPI00099E26FC|nr:acetylxylan esterase [Peterkaempfera griseoplana]
MALFDLPLDQLERYVPAVPEPADFDAFWRTTLKQDEATPVIIDVRPVDSGLRLVDTWDVTFAGFGGDPVRAWYTRPAQVDAPLPAVVEYLGYGRGRGLPHERLTWAAAGHAHLLMDSRGQGDQYGNGGDTPDPRSGPLGGPGAVTRGILSPEDYYYRRLITDSVRAVAALRALPGVDPARVAALGNSQGGGLALAVAGLVPDLAALMISAPFLCHLQRAIEITDAAPYGEIAGFLAVHREAEEQVRRTLSYVDGVSFARRAKAPVHLGVGLRDTVCPPSTVFAAYNHYGAATGTAATADRTVHVYPFNHHEGGEALHTRRQLAWLDARLRPGQQPPHPHPAPTAASPAPAAAAANSV